MAMRSTRLGGFTTAAGRRLAFRWLAIFLALWLAFPLPVWAQALTPFQFPYQVPSSGSSAGTEIESQPQSQPQSQQPIERREEPKVLRELWTFPVINIVEPRNGAIVSQADQSIIITFTDPRNELDPSSFRCLVNGIDRTKQFQISTGGAIWRPDPRRSLEAARDMALDRQGALFEGRTQDPLQPTLLDGQNSVVASIKNLSGNMATASVSFVLDTTTLLANRAVPRSSLEKAFLQPPSPPPSESLRRTAPAGPSISRDLIQFGYEAFRTLLPSLTPAANLPIDPNYTLGAGDILILYIWNVPGSALFDSMPLILDRTGSVFVPRVGSIPLQGLTVAQAQEVLRSRVSRYYSGFELRLSLGELRAISLYIMGEVARPGTYSISPFSTVLDALFAAGGPTKMGSLRAVRLTRNGQTIEEVDLYDFLLRGTRPHGAALQAGDTIFVPPIGPVSGITGEVKRPGIYELRPGTTLSTLIAMAGGPLPTAGLSRVQIERIQGGKGRVVMDIPLAPNQGGDGAEPLRDGDLVTIFPGQDRLENAVTVEGYVRTPGVYEWKPGMRVGDLLRPETLLPEAYPDRVEIARLRPDYSREVLSVDLRAVWNATSEDIPLQPLDKISVQSEVIGSWTVTLTGEVKRPGTYVIARGERLSSVLRRAGGFTALAFPKGAVFTRESLRQRERQNLEKFVTTQNQAMMGEGASLMAAGQTGAGVDAATLNAVMTQRRELIRSLASVVTVGRLSIHLESLETLEGTIDDIALENGDSLAVPQRPTSVLILGSVRNSTSVMHKEKENVEYYIARAGGATREADLEQTYILKPDGSAIASFVKVRTIEPGDAIIIPLSTEPRYRAIPMIKDVATILAGFAVPLGVVYGIFHH